MSSRQRPDPDQPWIAALAGYDEVVVCAGAILDHRAVATDRLDITLIEIRQEFRLIRTEIAEINRLLDKLPTKRQCWFMMVAVPIAMFPLFYLVARFVPLQ